MTTDKCQYCGLIHEGRICPLIKSIEYFENGLTIKRVEFHSYQSTERYTFTPLPSADQQAGRDWQFAMELSSRPMPLCYTKADC